MTGVLAKFLPIMLRTSVAGLKQKNLDESRILRIDLARPPLRVVGMSPRLASTGTMTR